MCDSGNRISLLYTDDETVLLELTKRYLEHTGKFIITTASSAGDALKMIHAQEFDAVVSDYQMPEMDGLAFLRALREEGNTIPFIIFTGKGREEVAIDALNAGADFYLQKGGKPNVQFGELQNVVRQVVERKRAEKRVLEYEQKMADVINFMPDAILVLNVEGEVIAWNRALEQLTGTPASGMLGKGGYECGVPFYGTKRPVLANMVLDHRLQNDVPYRVRYGDTGGKLYAETFISAFHNGGGAYLGVTASPLYDTDGMISGAIESIRDITDYKQTEGLYRTVFENTGTAMAIIDDEVIVSHINEEMKHLLGYTGDEPDMLLNWQERVVEEDREDILRRHRLRRTDPDCVPDSYDCRLRHLNGETVDVKLKSAMIPGTKKNIVSFIDITAQKKAERKLKFTQFTVDNGPDAIFWADYDGNFISVNKKATELFGYSKEELMNMGLSMFIPHFDMEIFHAYWDESLQSREFTFEVEVPYKNGDSVSTEISVVNLEYDGQKYGCAFVRDVSERKQVEKALYENEKKFREIFNSSSDAIFLNELSFDTGPKRFLAVNDATCNDLGYTREELLRMSLNDILLPEMKEQYADIIDQHRTKGRASFEGRAQRKDGSIITFETNSTIFQLDNRPVHLSVGRDVTERRAAENALKTLNKKLHLLSSITRHDINNQIFALMGYEELLKREIDGGKSSVYLEPIIEATERIHDQITFTRDYQELGVQSPAWQPVESLVHSVRQKLFALSVNIELNAGLPEIYADPLLEKVFYNLFENAARHGGHVTEIRVSFHEADGFGVLVIEDNGKGVPEDLKEKIFGRGFGSNTGFGLFLTREILDITDISISERGTEGTGARFEITVPKYGWRISE